MKQKKPPARIDRVLFIVIISLSLLGFLLMFDSSVIESYQTFGSPYALIRQQALGLVLGMIAFISTFILPPRFWIKFGNVGYIIGIFLLALVFVPGIGVELNGARRWVNAGFTLLQPIEVFKFLFIVSFAKWFSKHQRIRPFLALTAIPVFLLLLQPDLGSTLLLIFIATGMFFIAGGSLKKISLIGLSILPLVMLAIFLSPYRLERLKTFLNPNYDLQGSSFHMHQAIVAIGGGGFFGKGIGNSSQKFSYVPETSTDSIFAIVGEELGFVGAFSLIIAFGLFFWLVYKTAQLPNNNPEIRLLVFGLLLWIAGQTLLNLSAIVGLIPLTGTPLPFFSYGRSSLIMILFASGNILQVARQNR